MRITINQSISQPHLYLALKEKPELEKLIGFLFDHQNQNVLWRCGQILLNDILIGHVKEILQFSYDFECRMSHCSF